MCLCPGSRSILSTLFVLCFSLTFMSGAGAADWPGWRGPERTGISKETGLLKEWPKEGPPLAWKANGIGEGYSGVSVAGGKVFTMGNRGGQEVVVALDGATGKEAWAAVVGDVRADGGGYPGPRSTPTVDGQLLYALGLNGDLLCLEAATGKDRWRKSLVKDFQGEMPGWGYSESPLVDGERLLVTPGGKEATIVALDKKSGDIIWKGRVPRGSSGTSYNQDDRKSDRAAYSSIITAQVGKTRQYIQLLQTGVAGISAEDGKFLWRYNKSANGTANIATSIFHDNCVFTASSYGTGGGLVKLAEEKGRVTATEVYFTKKMKNHHGGLVLLENHLYGFDEGKLRCLEFRTGKQAWENDSVGKGSLVYADGRLYARSEGGPVALIEATPQGYVEKGRFNQPERSRKNAWPHPVVAGGRLYLRDQDLLLVYDVQDHGPGGKTTAGGE